MKTLSTFWYIKTIVAHFAVNLEIRIIFVTIFLFLFLCFKFIRTFSLCWLSQTYCTSRQVRRQERTLRWHFWNQPARFTKTCRTECMLSGTLSRSPCFFILVPRRLMTVFFTFYLKHSRGLLVFFLHQATVI